MAQVLEVGPGIFLGRGTHVNFVIVRDGTDVTLIDAGYPGDVGRVEAAVRAVGRRPEDIRSLLITHAHVDHIGAASHFAQRYGTPVLTGPVEVAHAHRERLEQAGPADVLRNLLRPGLPAWLARVALVGALSKAGAASAQAVAAGPLDLPGRPVAIATPGHTSGHTAYHLPDFGVIVTGDALVSGHPLLTEPGPQLLPAMFNHGDTLTALAALADLDADVILPGHGNILHQRIADAVADARDRAGT